MDKKIQLGQFFTPKHIVDEVVKLLQKNSVDTNLFLDTSCGIGDFSIFNNFIGVDIDSDNIKEAISLHPNKKFLLGNSLTKDVSRETLNINNYITKYWYIYNILLTFQYFFYLFVRYANHIQSF